MEGFLTLAAKGICLLSDPETPLLVIFRSLDNHLSLIYSIVTTWKVNIPDIDQQHRACRRKMAIHFEQQWGEHRPLRKLILQVPISTFVASWIYFYLIKLNQEDAIRRDVA